MRLLITVYLLSLYSCGMTQPINQHQVNEKSIILQKSIDLIQLQPYFRGDTSKIQLTILINELVNDYKELELRKFNKAVIFKTDKEIKEENINKYFVLGEYLKVDNTLRVQFSYIGEGILISIMFKKINNEWVATNPFIDQE